MNMNVSKISKNSIRAFIFLFTQISFGVLYISNKIKILLKRRHFLNAFSLSLLILAKVGGTTLGIIFFFFLTFSISGYDFYAD